MVPRSDEPSPADEQRIDRDRVITLLGEQRRGCLDNELTGGVPPIQATIQQKLLDRRSVGMVNRLSVGL